MNPRECILNILLKLDKDGAYVNKVINDEFTHNEFSDLDKRFITEVVMGCVRNRDLLDFYIMQFSKVKIKKMSLAVRNILETGAYQVIFLDKVPDSAACNESVKLARKYVYKSSGFINGILRNISRNKYNLKQPDKSMGTIEYLSIKYSYPVWLTEMLAKQYGNDTCEKIYISANKPYSPMIRANRLKADLWENRRFSQYKFIELLKHDGIDVCADGELDTCFHVDGNLDIKHSQSYKDGYYTLQNRSSQLAVKALDPKPNEFIIDMCAAPGGKTTAIAELMDNMGKIIAFDVHEHKIELINNAAKRLKIDIIDAERHDASVFDERYFKLADRVLVDAPCSGFGVLHTKPDIKRSRKPEDIDELVKIQEKILNAAAKYVKPGGILVYSTCTILKQENELQIKNFLHNHSEFELEYENMLFTHVEGGSGFYIAKMICNKNKNDGYK